MQWFHMNTCVKTHRAGWKQNPPSTNSKLDRIEPMREAATTVYRPLVNATMERISSTTLPKVAFSSPPTVGPKRTAKSSVISPRMSAKGTSPMIFCSSN